VAAARQVMATPGEDFEDIYVFHRYVALAAATTVCLLSALAVMLLYLFARRLGASEVAAVFGAGTLAFATPFFGWSSTFFAHPASGSVLLIAAMVVGWRREADEGLPFWRGLLTGLLLGYLLVIDLTAAPPAVLIGVWALVRSADRVREVAGLVLGGLVGIAPLLIYNAIVFGSPFTLGYSQVVGFEGMKTGFFGVSLPNPVVLGELLFGHFRGLLPLSPVLLLVPFGLWAMWKTPALRGLALVIAGTIASYLFINAGYHYWDGGASTGPRHLVAMLPLSAIALVFAWPPRQSQQVVVVALLCLSLVLSLIVASAGVFADSRIANPLFDLLIPRLGLPDVFGKWVLVPLFWIGFASVLLLPEESGAKRNQLAA
jgi:hypothetical protein